MGKTIELCWFLLKGATPGRLVFWGGYDTHAHCNGALSLVNKTRASNLKLHILELPRLNRCCFAVQENARLRAFTGE